MEVLSRLAQVSELWAASSSPFVVSTVTVLTPACTVKVLTAGYVPEVHASVG